MLNSRSSKIAMTLSEILLCIGIIGVIAAITLPILKKVIPTKEESFHKKTNYTVEQVVSQLYDDEAMYPRKSDFNAQGFQNLEKVTISGVEYGGKVETANATELRKAKEKFCRLFASKFEFSSESGPLVCENQKNDSKSGNNVTLALGKRSFRSKDNVDWYLPVTDFKYGAAQIMVDVNNVDGPNCSKEDAGCSKPDRFIYYVKPNGSITYEQPKEVLKNKFQIIVNATTEGCPNGGACNKKGGSFYIAPVNSSGNAGAFGGKNLGKSNIQSNTKFIIKAVPAPGYYVNWSMDRQLKAPAKRVKVYNSDVYVDLKFLKKSTYCVVVDYENCDQSDVTNCATAQLISGCGYKKVTNKQGVYKLNSDEVYEYVGLGVDGGEYNYVCGGLQDTYGNNIPSTTTTLKFGRPVRDPATGAVNIDESYQSAHTCDKNYTGDYKLKVTPKPGYKVHPMTTEHPDGLYEQDVRLGTEDLYFTVSLER